MLKCEDADLYDLMKSLNHLTQICTSRVVNLNVINVIYNLIYNHLECI